MIKSENQELK